MSDLAPIADGLGASIRSLAHAVARRQVAEEFEAVVGTDVDLCEIARYRERVDELQHRLVRQVVVGGLGGRATEADDYVWEVPARVNDAYLCVGGYPAWDAWGEDGWKSIPFRAAIRAARDLEFLDALRSALALGGEAAVVSMFPPIPERPKTGAELRAEAEAESAWSELMSRVR